MSVTVSIRNTTATLDRTWTCDRQVIQDYLNLKLQSVDVLSSAPNRPLALAQACIEDFGGEVLHYDEIPSEDGVVY